VKHAGLVAVLLVIAALSSAAAPAAARGDSRAIAACIRDPGCHRTYVVAHRADGFGAPGNSRAAVTRAVEARVPIVEIDVRESRDGQLFVFHDGKLDGASTGKGRLDALPAAEIAQARLRNGETVPRLDEVYAVSRGRAVLSVDFKVAPETMARVAEWIAAHGSFDDLIFFANTGEEMVMAARLKTRYPAMLVMVRILDTRVTVDSTRAIFGRLPEILHTDRIAATEVAALHALGTKVYVNALPIERYWPPFNHFAVRSLLATKVDFILTGDPVALLRKVSASRTPAGAGTAASLATSFRVR
jgi:glycerophosphoryl diester phosphodiesterase